MEIQETVQKLDELTDRIQECIEGENLHILCGALGSILAAAVAECFPDPEIRGEAFESLVECMRESMNQEKGPLH